ncbi:MAG: arginine--tRNA ligase, partial [Bacteroidales bacterium]
MISIEKKIEDTVIKGVKELYQVEINSSAIQLQKTNKEFEGDVTLVVFPFVKFARKAPAQTALQMGEYLKAKLPEITAFNAVNGFLNLQISSTYWLERFNDFRLEAQSKENSVSSTASSATATA